MQGLVAQRDIDHVLAGRSHRLRDGHRHLARLAEAEADSASAVADHGQGCEAELASTLDGLRGAVDRDQLLEEVVGRLGSFGSCH